MPDEFPQITLDPSLTAQPQPVQATPAQSTQSVPLQPIPPVTPPTAIPQPLPKLDAMKPLPSAAPAPTDSHTDLTDRRTQVQVELERLQAEESSMLNNIKDWLTKVQGAETKQQALERELFALDRKLVSVPSPTQLAAERETKLAQYTQELKQAETKIKEITKLQKIDEKKAFDNYSAGGLDRQGLLDQMEIIRQRYADQLAAVQSMVTAAQTAITELDQPTQPMTPVAELLPTTPEVAPAMPEVKPAPVLPTTTNGNPLITKLAALPEAATGLLHHLVVELPNQGTFPTIERSSDGTGIIISADGNATITDRCFLADADLLRAGATAEDIIPLAISQSSSKDATPLPVATA